MYNFIKKSSISISILLILSILLSSCTSSGMNKITIKSIPQPEGQSAAQWSQPSAAASIKPYSVKPDLSNVSNLESFMHLSILDKYMLSRNLFVIKKTDESLEQPFDIYEKNISEGIPSFITSDSVLHIYYMMFNYTLGAVEKERLASELKTFTEGAFNQSIAIYNGLSEPNARKAALKNIAYFGIAMRLLELNLPGGIPMEASRIIDNDVKKIRVRWESGSSELFPYTIDYKKYIAKGQYSRDTDLNKYFLTLMWYGNTPFIFDMYNSKTGSSTRLDEPMAMAMIMSAGILGDENLRKLWEDLYKVTTAFSGKAGDINIYDFSTIINSVYGKNVDLNKLWNSAKLQKVYELTKQSYARHSSETIAGRIKLSNTGVRLETQFRLMGQMYSIENDIYSNLTLTDSTGLNKERSLPKGLDVPSAFGSEEAFSVLKDEMNEEKAWIKYPENVKRLQGIFSGINGDSPQDYSFNNLYLWVLKAFAGSYGNGYPAFMTSDAWNSKRLITFAGAVSDSMHQSYLVAKQGEAENEEIKDSGTLDFPGYVEPEVGLYSRLEYTTVQMRNFLSSSNFKNKGIYEALNSFIDTVRFLNNISSKELESKPFSEEEENRLKNMAVELRELTLNMVEGSDETKAWGLIPAIDRSMASVSDAYSEGSQVLQTALGYPDYIYVVVPYNDKVYLTRGSVYSYYEFVKPVSKKLDDKQWQNILKSGKEIEQQMWIKKIRY